MFLEGCQISQLSFQLLHYQINNPTRFLKFLIPINPKIFRIYYYLSGKNSSNALKPTIIYIFSH
jgi:hypothetical protein